MRLASIPIAKEVRQLVGGNCYQAMICGSMLNLAELKGLEPRLATLPIADFGFRIADLKSVRR